jgi:hypothetical protein
MRHLRENNLDWELATLYRTTATNMRKIERKVKGMANGPRYCSICTPMQQVPKIPGCDFYERDLVPFPISSYLLRSAEKGASEQVGVRFATAEDQFDTVNRLLEVSKRDKDALGFVPMGGDNKEWGLDRLLGLSQVALAIEGSHVVGYCSYTINPGQTRVRIHQCVTDDSFRLRGHGRRMVEAIATKHPELELSANVRDDLAANHFWSTLGFVPMEQKTHKTSGSKINYYVRQPKGVSI